MVRGVFNLIFDFDDVPDGAGPEPTGLQIDIGRSLIQRAGSIPNIQLSNLLAKFALHYDKR